MPKSRPSSVQVFHDKERNNKLTIIRLLWPYLNVIQSFQSCFNKEAWRNFIYSLITFVLAPADVICTLRPEHRKHDQLFTTIFTEINRTNFHAKCDGVSRADALLRQMIFQLEWYRRLDVSLKMEARTVEETAIFGNDAYVIEHIQM